MQCPLSFVKSFIPFMFQIFELNHIASNIFEVMELLVMILGPRRPIGHIKEGVNNNLIIPDLSICQGDIPPASKHHCEILLA